MCSVTIDELRDVLLVRAWEDAPGSDELLPRPERWEASEAARRSSGLEYGQSPDERTLAAFLAQRARALTETLGSRSAGARRALRATSARLGRTPVVLLALAIGLGSNALGPAKRINVVANPLTGLVLWNLGVFLWIAVSSFALGGERNGARWLAETWTRLRHGRSDADDPSLRFLEDWSERAGPWIAASTRRALHLAAFAMVAGSLASMYLRGLVFEYRVVWESTFVQPETMASFLGVAFAPASALSGIEVPSADVIGAMREEGGGDAAPWIHLYAITTALFVLVPRAALAAASGLRARRLAASLPLDVDSPYFRRLLAAREGTGVAARIVPYSHAVGARPAERLRGLLHEVLGPRAAIEPAEPLEYGAEAGEVRLADREGELWLAVVFGLAQTPEAEVHGRLVEALAERLSGRGGVLAFVDASSWNARVGSGSEGEPDPRAAERRRAWDLVLADAGSEALHLDLASDADRAAVERTLARVQAS